MVASTGTKVLSGWHILRSTAVNEMRKRAHCGHHAVHATLLQTQFHISVSLVWRFDTPKVLQSEGLAFTPTGPPKWEILFPRAFLPILQSTVFQNSISCSLILGVVETVLIKHYPNTNPNPIPWSYIITITLTLTLIVTLTLWTLNCISNHEMAPQWERCLIMRPRKSERILHM